jgi:hypothetical protein
MRRAGAIPIRLRKLRIPKRIVYARPVGQRLRSTPNSAEFLLLYETVCTATEPEVTLLGFLLSTYDAAAETGHWHRAALECSRSGRGARKGLKAIFPY